MGQEGKVKEGLRQGEEEQREALDKGEEGKEGLRHEGGRQGRLDTQGGRAKEA